MSPKRRLAIHQVFHLYGLLVLWVCTPALWGPTFGQSAGDALRRAADENNNAPHTHRFFARERKMPGVVTVSEIQLATILDRMNLSDEKQPCTPQRLAKDDVSLSSLLQRNPRPQAPQNADITLTSLLASTPALSAEQRARASTEQHKRPYEAHESWGSSKKRTYEEEGQQRGAVKKTRAV